MAPELMRAGRGCRGVFLVALALSSIVNVTHAVQWLVGGDVQKWSFLHSNDAPTFFNDWANDNKTFTTGDTLLFVYDNATHSVQQLPESDFAACNLTAPFREWYSGRDAVLIAEAGTFYYVCGAPTNCLQGMKVAITAFGTPVAVPTAPPLSIVPLPAGPDASLADGAPVAVYAGASSLFLILAILSW